MSIIEHKTSFAGSPLTEWGHDSHLSPVHAYRMAVEFGEAISWPEKFARFVHSPAAHDTETLVIGAWWGEDFLARADVLVEALVAHHARMPHLRALFMGDVIAKDTEISWITQTDLSPIFLAYPHLEHFGTRGADGLRLGFLHHHHLRSFVLQSGGTSTAIIQQLAGAHLPQLTDFELWTGSSSYGWNGTLADMLPFIRGEVFPDLTRLGICNSEITDEVVQALVQSPLLDRLEDLDLSRGTLGDVGAKALLAHPATRQLRSLNVMHHFCSPSIEAQLRELAGSGVKVSIDGALDTQDWANGRYVAVGE